MLWKCILYFNDETVFYLNCMAFCTDKILLWSKNRTIYYSYFIAIWISDIHLFNASEMHCGNSLLHIYHIFRFLFQIYDISFQFLNVFFPICYIVGHLNTAIDQSTDFAQALNLIYILKFSVTFWYLINNHSLFWSSFCV